MLNTSALLDRLRPGRAASRVIDAALDNLARRRLAIAAVNPARKGERARAELQAALDRQRGSPAMPSWSHWVPWKTWQEAERDRLAQEVAMAHARLAAVAPTREEVQDYRAWRDAENARLDAEEATVGSIAYAIGDGDGDIVHALASGGMEAARRLESFRPDWNRRNRFGDAGVV